MNLVCTECGSEVNVDEAVDNEIVSCPICGLDLIIKIDDSGNISLKELAIEGEDWGE
ncbi:lysine biosynthesis protein LysW [Candidatus Bathyarchaeota archaeon]|nr:lysine biosynthesis protein LysW [Candidatus Bathyarchaeota archaeon]